MHTQALTPRYKPKRSSNQIIRSLKVIYIEEKEKTLKTTYDVQLSK